MPCFGGVGGCRSRELGSAVPTGPARALPLGGLAFGPAFLGRAGWFRGVVSCRLAAPGSGAVGTGGSLRACDDRGQDRGRIPAAQARTPIPVCHLDETIEHTISVVNRPLVSRR